MKTVVMCLRGHLMKSVRNDAHKWRDIVYFVYRLVYVM